MHTKFRGPLSSIILNRSQYIPTKGHILKEWRLNEERATGFQARV